MKMENQAWKGFHGGEWQRSIDVRSFIQKNWTPTRGTAAFLPAPHGAPGRCGSGVRDLLRQELRKGVLDVETHIVSGIDSFAPGYIDRENEVIVGLQTDAPLKRIVNLYGGTRMARSALEQYGYRLDPEIEDHFSQYRKTHNEGVFDAYPERTRKARHAGLLTRPAGRLRPGEDHRGLPPGCPVRHRPVGGGKRTGPGRPGRPHGRGARPPAGGGLGADPGPGGDEKMAARYGVDLSRPSATAREAVQAVYLAYLAGIKGRTTGPPPPWAAPPPSWTSTSSGTWRRGSSPRRRPRS